MASYEEKKMKIKDIKKLENVQRRATKFILCKPKCISIDYNQRLMQLKLLPLTYYFEMADVMFLVNSSKYRTDRFDSSLTISSFEFDYNSSFSKAIAGRIFFGPTFDLAL